MTKTRRFGKILDDLEDKAHKKSNRTDCGKTEKLVDWEFRSSVIWCCVITVLLSDISKA